MSRPAHNHGPEEGPGLACREHKIGECQIDALTVTEREARMREREAFWLGAGWRVGSPSPASADAEAKRRYPITKRVPRTLKDEATNPGEWKWENGGFHVRHKGEGWTNPCGYVITADRVRVWADLLANPFEEVEE